VLSGRGLCDGLITRPESTRRCVRSRNLVNEEALAQWGGGAVAQKTNKQTLTQLLNFYVLLTVYPNIVVFLPSLY